MDQKKLRIWTLFMQSELELCDTNNQQSNQSVKLTLFFPMFSLHLPENIVCSGSDLKQCEAYLTSLIKVMK